jgi:hypothetical protein
MLRRNMVLRKEHDAKKEEYSKRKDGAGRGGNILLRGEHGVTVVRSIIPKEEV